MGLIQKKIELFFGKKNTAKEISFEEANGIIESEIAAEEKALCDFASGKFAEIKHLLSELSRNSEEMEKHEIRVDEGNKAYRQIVSTSQKNLARHLKGIPGKIAPPSRLDAAFVRRYAPAALRAVSADLMPYWKNIALARLMLRDEVKAIGASLQELHTALEGLDNAAFSQKWQSLQAAKSAFEKTAKKKSELSVISQKRDETQKTIADGSKSLATLCSELSEKELSKDAQRLKSLEDGAVALERRKEQVVSEFNSEIAPLEKVLKRLSQISETGDSLTQREKELLKMLLSSPFSAFISDPNGVGCKSIFSKAADSISKGNVRLKEGEVEKKLAAINSLLSKDFFSEYFWETNKIEAELLKVQKEISGFGFSSEISSLRSEVLAVQKALEKQKVELSQLSGESVSAQLSELKSGAIAAFSKATGNSYKIKSGYSEPL